MNIEWEPMFHLPKWSLNINDFKMKQEQLTNLLGEYPEKPNPFGNFLTNRAACEDDGGSKLIEKFILILQEELKEVAQAVQKHVAVTSVWSASYPQNTYHPVHNHGSLGLSGIIYLVQEPQHPQTIFVCPWNNWITDETLLSPPKVEEGQLVLVPSMLLHYTEPNPLLRPKRIIGFDAKLS